MSEAAPLLKLEPPPPPVTLQPMATPMQLLGMAVSHGADMSTIERLVSLHEHMAARDAEQAFNAAMSRAQAKMGRVSSDAVNPQTKSKYASYAAIDKEIRPIYSDEGFALSFDTGGFTPDTLEVLCYVSHSGGHTRTYRAHIPNDGKGAKGGDVMTKTHANGAAMSYGMRYLVKMIFNVAVGEDDRDGNPGAKPQQDMDDKTFHDHMTAIQKAASLGSLQAAFTTAYRAAKTDGTKKALMAAKDTRKAELSGGAQ